MSFLHPGDAIRLTIDDLDSDGSGVGTISSDIVSSRASTESTQPGLQLHVAGALPGEDVTARVDALSQQRPTAWGALLSLHKPSASRVAPVCRAHGRCGGCVLQHLDYPAQLAWKDGDFRRQVATAPSLASTLVHPPVPSPKPFGYRNKSKLVAGTDEDGALILGAFSPRTHDVVDLSGCAIAQAPLDAVAQSAIDVLRRHAVTPYDERLLVGTLRYVILRANVFGHVQMTFVTSSSSFPEAGAVIADLRERHPEIVGVIQDVNETRGNVIHGDADRLLWGAMTLDDEVGGVKLRLSPRAFFQANRDVAALAYAAIKAAIAPRPSDVVVDAYAGVGGIALTLAPHVGRVLGIEEHASAVEDATANAQLNGCANVAFVAGDVADHVRDIGSADIVVLNPPRRGCAGAVLEQAAALAPRTMAYLSCAPATLLRDLERLHTLGYETTSLTPFDMLPHTPHLEALAILSRRD